MVKSWPIQFSSVAFLVVILFSCCGAVDEDKKVYIVYLGSLNDQSSDFTPQYSYHRTILQQVLDQQSSVSDSLITSYTRSINGFAARLTDVERDRLASLNGVVSVFPSKTLYPKTTRSWDFMGFDSGAETLSTIHRLIPEKDIIVGVIDTGIWPESESFKDEGLGPPPAKWRGTCDGGKNFTCNNKIIGARYYPKPSSSSSSGNESARDDAGHGSHTASIAAGNKVKNASFYGIAQGIARGGVPAARVAAYKVCHLNVGCNESDILAAFDDAIADGVDVISVSLGPSSPEDFKDDAIAIGSFHGMTRGILTVQAAGNNGPLQGSTVSVSPWILTVAASSTDRRIIDKVILGDGNTVVGHSVNSFSLNGTKKVPMILGTNARSSNCSTDAESPCDNGCLDSNLVKGKIVVCNVLGDVTEAYRAGAIGLIGFNQFTNVSIVVPLPALGLDVVSSDVSNYMKNSTKIHQGEILKSEAIINGTDHPPLVAEFSSRGPNTIIPEIMKPDISAPGVEILAAYSPIASPSNIPQDTRSVNYSILSGTSMACPHVTAVAVYVKTFHPDWSPSEIKSAIMTTALPMNGTQFIAQEFASGSGHVNPLQAVNPGLVYELGKDDYVKLLCSKGYDDRKLRLISGDNTTTCPTAASSKLLPQDVNYPAMAAQVLPEKPFGVSFHRTVKNVGVANSTYKVSVSPSVSRINVSVVPEVLSFNSLKEKRSFVATVNGGEIGAETMLSASVVWSDGTHSVTSPIVVYVISI
ncbi:hypothetical protein FNV43_RR20564 [Rhamnella rubrinervis]|uniref:Uncharacterized protein n=1 Tax=Rhamnella rubrinervis TaxID=2594499 RepID=A0A8K0E0L1_9ROSA|nr:hypothetical protein FNV43_RR20564 [Rhamnella rubrinervis]